MALIPLLFDEPFFSRPSRHHHFGFPDPEEFYQPLGWLMRPSSSGYLNPWREISSDSNATVSYDKNKFQANVDVQQFKPNEISVKISDDNTVTIEGKHEEKQDEHGYISRQFVRRYVLPKNCDVQRIESKLSSDGVLTITAPTIDAKDSEKTIPITQTGQPAKKIEQKKQEKKE